MEHRINKFVGSHVFSVLIISPILSFCLTRFVMHGTMGASILAAFVASWLMNLFMLIEFKREMTRAIKLESLHRP